MIKKFLEHTSNPLKVEVRVDDRKTNEPRTFIETIDKYNHEEVMSRKWGFITKLHALLGEKYDTKETRYIGFEWLDN